MASQYPIVITEFGSSLTNGVYNRDVVEYADRHKLSWSVYSWNRDWGDTMGIVTNGAWSTYHTSSRGVPILTNLWAARGWTNYGGAPDPAPSVVPGAITNLTATVTNLPSGEGAILLHWTAPGRDGYTGTASYYEIRCTPAPWADWHSLGAAVSLPHAVSDVPIPKPAGTLQSTLIRGLDVNQRWSFMVRAGHEKSTSNWLSPVSNFARSGNKRTYVRFYGWRYDQNYAQFGGNPGPSWAEDKDANGNRVANPSGNTIFGRLNSAVWQMVSVDPGTYQLNAMMKGNQAKVSFKVTSSATAITVPVTSNWSVHSVVLTVTANNEFLTVNPSAAITGNFDVLLDWVELVKL